MKGQVASGPDATRVRVRRMEDMAERKTGAEAEDEGDQAGDEHVCR